MEIRWQVEDGYVGAAKHSFDINDDDFLDCDTVEEALKMVEDYAQQEFENKVSWCFSNFDEFRAEVEKIFESKKKDEE